MPIPKRVCINYKPSWAWDNEFVERTSIVGRALNLFGQGYGYEHRGTLARSAATLVSSSRQGPHAVLEVYVFVVAAELLRVGEC